MADLYETPVRVDTNSKPDDLRMNFIDGPNLPVPFLGVAESGSTIPANAGPLAALAGVTLTGGAQKITLGFTPQANADTYYFEYFATNNPTVKTGVIVSSGDAIPAISGVNISARGMARLSYGRGSWVLGAFSSLVTGAATS